MSNCVFVQAGQCGNQLGFSLIDEIYKHLEPNDDNLQLETYFRTDRKGRTVSRAVCFDTEPKVINDNFMKTERNGRWFIDKKSAAYRHGGAGNNWALGYQMASGEFLETSLNCIRRELEMCDHSQTLVFIHSVAGGTGSGLGTHLTEACQDSFPQSTRLNIAVTPYHFGEVIVQHYNSMLCLSKIANASHGVISFENETALQLCQTMQSIARPTMDNINATITANLVPIFLPKVTCSERNRPSVSASGRVKPLHFASLIDDVILLCSHPGYRFLDVKTTPQTSSASVKFTYDSWFTLLKTVQSMQLSGAASERYIKQHLKRSQHYTAADPSYEHSLSNLRIASTRHSVESNLTESTSYEPSVRGGRNGPPAQPQDNSLIKSLASCVTFYGLDSADTAWELYTNYSKPAEQPLDEREEDVGDDYPERSVAGSVRPMSNLFGNSNSHTNGSMSSSSTRVNNSSGGTSFNAVRSSSARSSVRSTASSRMSHTHTKVASRQELHFSEEYLRSHQTAAGLTGGHGSSDGRPITINHSPYSANKYQRSTSVLSNNQAILPLLQRVSARAADLFRMSAYTHQYYCYGLEEDDFRHAFHTVGSVVNNYLEL